MSSHQQTRSRFKVTSPLRSLVLCRENHSEMDEWLKNAQESKDGPRLKDGTAAEFLGGNHVWYSTGHARPIYCNVCRDTLHGVKSHGLSCEVCKYKVHKRCSAKAINNCKWTTLASVGKDIIEDPDGNITMPHQWMEGNLPVSSRCNVCEKTCGSVLRLQDWRCLWCKATVHTACRPSMSINCPLGPARLSVVPPTALHSIGSDEAWEAVRPTGCSPLLVFVNSKSGDNQGIKFLRRFKQLLNPAQVFDLIKGGPGPGLRLFRHFDPFRILVCSGDGSVGWVLSEIDRLGMHKQCQVGVLPLGTGNDLARVLGWGASCDDDTHLPQLLEKYEKAGTKMLDRWSIMTYERSISLRKLSINQNEDSSLSIPVIQEFEDSVISHISAILETDKEDILINSAKDLCETVREFVSRVTITAVSLGTEQALEEKCMILQNKVEELSEVLNRYDDISDLTDNADLETFACDLPSLNDNQEKGVLEKPEKDMTNRKKLRQKRESVEKNEILSRVGNLKNAVRSVIDQTEMAIEEHLRPGSSAKSKKASTNTLSSDASSSYLSKNDNLLFPLTPTNHADSMTPTSGSETSPCSSPMPNLVSLSPMPDLRRDSQADELLTLPAPDGFADSRRNSSNVPQDVFSFDDSSLEKTVKEILEEKSIPKMVKQQSVESNLTQSDVQTTVTPKTLDTSSIDDTTIQDTMISPDSDSPGNAKGDQENGNKIDKGSCSNSIISTDSIASEALDSKFSFLVKNSESEIGHIDSDILDSIKHSGSEICHIDSPENSDLSDVVNSESIVEDISSLNQDLNSAMLGERYDSVRDCLKSEQVEKPKKYCCLAKFAEGSDIARRSVKRPSRTSATNNVDMLKSTCPGFNEEVTKTVSKDGNFKPPECGHDKQTHCIEETSVPLIKRNPNFPSIIVDPPSPSISTKSRHEKDLRDFIHPHFRRPSGESVQKLHVEYLDTGCSPQATRRISSGSLLKPSEVVSLAAAAKFGSNMSLRHERSKSVDKTEDVKKLPIINPLVRLPMWPNVTSGAGLISQALLANADALCAAVSPLMDPDETLLEGYSERCVMNNYFGIGIDAKISLDFHQKREEHPEKCRSRAKNYMWYGVLGSKQWLQKTYKNLDQRVQLECDGQRIPLPSLQGIVVLNIPSFMGGTNFWGSRKEGDIFLAPSFDDRVLEVVAVFGSVQMAASRLINLQHHRIAQCHSVQINILGDEEVPIQVDGEAWLQSPGIIRIIHKNRMQMLSRNRALEESLKAWEEKQRHSMAAVLSQSTSTLSSAHLSQHRNSFMEGKELNLVDDELNVLFGFIEVVATLVKWVKLLIVSHPSLERDLYMIAAQTSAAIEKIHPDGKILQGPTLRPIVTELVSSARQLYEESCELLRDKAHHLKLREDLENKLSISLATMEQELKKCVFDENGCGLVYLQNLPVDEQADKKNRHRGLFWLKFRRSVPPGGSGQRSMRDQVTLWGVQEVCIWLENLQLGEYTSNFISHDIRGKELLALARRDLKELGITKIGHVKRIQQAIHDLNN